MSDRINLLRRLSSLDRAPEFDGVTKLICNIDDETQMIVGDDTGYAMEFDNPLMTQAVLAAMLSKIRGYQYQPYQAEGALLDPAAEMGDAVSMRGLYGGIFTRSRNFSRLMKANISAPADEEIDHEYKFETKQERKVKRQIGDVRATLLIQADQIAAEVSQREADSEEFRSQFEIQATQIAAKVTADTSENKSSFGWKLTSDSWEVFSNNSTVLKATRSGLEVSGKITATSGKIGGFDIGSNAIYNNISVFGGTQSTGVYLGTNGIQLGKNFKVDSSGNLTASSGTFTGSVRAGSIMYGGNNGTVNADALTNYSIGSSKYSGGSVNNSALGNSSVSYGKTSFQGTLDQVGRNANDISVLSSRIASISAGYFNSISTSSILFGNYSLYVYNGQVYASYVG